MSTVQQKHHDNCLCPRCRAKQRPEFASRRQLEHLNNCSCPRCRRKQRQKLALQPQPTSSEFEETFLDSIWDWFSGDSTGQVDRNSREYVRWVQASLNKILGLQLAVDGISGTKTRSAVRTFQQRYGLTVDGLVGENTEKALIRAGAGQPPRSSTPNVRPAATSGIDVPLPASGPGFYSTKSAARRYGLQGTIDALLAIGHEWQRRYPNGPRIGIGDISFKGGGSMPPHVSHDKGVDIDIRLMRNDGQEKPTHYRYATYSRTLTQELVNVIIRNGIMRVQYIFFNDPKVKGVREQPGHDDHLHVRFYPPG